MKKLFTIFMIMFIGLSGLIFGCDGRYDNLTITITTEQQRAEDGSITLYVGGPSEEITITMAGAPKNFNYVPSFSFSNPEKISVSAANNMIENGVKKTLTALEPGSTIMTVMTSEGGKTASLNINIIKKADSISFKKGYSLAMIRKAGETATIEYDTALEINPPDSNQNFIRYELKTQTQDVVIDPQTGVLTVINGNTALDYVEVYARLVDHLGNVEPIAPAETKVYLIDEILDEDINLYVGDSLEDVIDANLVKNPITLAKNIETLNYVKLILTVKTDQEINIITPQFTTTSPIMVTEDVSKRREVNGVQQFYFTVSAIRYNLDYTLRFDIELINFKNQFDYHKNLNLICDIYAKDFEINNVVRTGAHDLSLYTNDLTSGTSMLVAISNPREISDYNGRFTISLYDGDQLVTNQDTVNEFFEIRANGPVDIIDNIFNNNTQFFIKIKEGKLTTADSGRFKFVIKAVLPENEDLQATTTVNLLIKQGIESLDSFVYEQNGNSITSNFGEQSPVKLNFENTVSLNFSLNVTPIDADLSTVKARSSDEGIVRVEKIGDVFRLVPVSVGTARITLSSTNLDSEKYFIVNVYEPINDFYINIDNNSLNNNIGEIISNNNSLVSVVAKQGRTINLIFTTNPLNAQFYEVEYSVFNAGGIELTNTDGIISDQNLQLNTKENTFTFINQDNDAQYTVKVTITNFDGDVIEKQFTLSSYIPIESIDMSLSRTELYNPNNLGYFDLYGSTSYTSTNAAISIMPSNATFIENVNYIVRVDGKVENSNILIRNGSVFSINPEYPITKYPQRVYIVAQIQEYNRQVSVSKEIIIRDPITVDSLAVDGVSNNMLYFKQGITQSSTIKVSVQPSKGVFNSGIKWALYAEGSDTLLDFADNAERNPQIDRTNAIVKVVANGNNNFIITPVEGKVGNARLVLIPEDKITDFQNNRYIYDWDGVVEIFITVADGSEQNPYHVSTYQDLKDIDLAIDKYYVLTNDIVATDMWIPIGYGADREFTGGINGQYSRLVNAETNEYVYKQYKITGLVYASASISEYSNFGLVSINNGSLKNLQVEWDYIQSEFRGYVGGIASINRGTIQDCQVTFNSVNIIVDSNIYFGGIAGFLDGGNITNTNTSQTIYGQNISITTKENMSNVFAGGIAGYVNQESTIIGSLLSLENDQNPTINYGDAGFDVTLNLDVNMPQIEIVEGVLIGIGGVIGGISGDEKLANSTNISNICVQGTINASGLQNVGGFVGNASFCQITNCFSSTRVVGKEFVGGFIGRANTVTMSFCSAENYNNNDNIRAFVTADTNFGGFGGIVENSDLSYSYAISYFDSITSYDLQCTGAEGAQKCIGGFVANLNASKVNYCASNVNINVNGGNRNYIGGFIGNMISCDVDNVYCRGFSSEVTVRMVGSDSEAIDYDSTYYSTYNVKNESLDQDDPLNTEATTGFAKGSGLFEGTEESPKYWKIDSNINNGLPIIIRQDGRELFANLPIVVELTVKNNTQNITDIEELKQQGYLYVDDKTVLVFYNNLTDGTLDLSQLTAINNYNLNYFVNTSITPLTQKTARLNISSSNTNVIKVNRDGTIQVVGEGSAKLTISSKLNVNYNDTITVVVTLGINDFDLYQSSNLADSSKVINDPANPINTFVNGTYPLFSKISYQRQIDGESISLQSNQKANIRYILTNTADRDYVIINKDWLYDNDNGYYYVDVPYNTLALILPKVKANANIEIKAVPYIAISYNQNLLLNYLEKSFYVNIKNGATNIYFETNAVDIEITQLQTLILTVVIETDTVEDDIENIATNTVNADEDKYTQSEDGYYSSELLTISRNSSKETIFDETTGEVVAIKSKFTISYPYNPNSTDEENLLKNAMKFKLSFKSQLSENIKKDITLTVLPQAIVSVDAGLYSNYSDYLIKDGTDKYIFNGVNALLTVEVYPYFSKFDRFEVLYSSQSIYDISLTQLSFDRNKVNEDGSGAENALSNYINSGSEYIKGYGIKINKATGADSLIGSDDGIYSYSKLYYISLLIGSEVPDLTEFTISLRFYSDNEQVRPYDTTFTIWSLSQPFIDFELNDGQLNNTLPIGTQNKLNVTVNNFDGDIEWNVTIKSSKTGLTDEEQIIEDEKISELNSNYALMQQLTPKIVNGEYFINIPDNEGNEISEGTIKDLIGTYLVVTGKVTKTDNSENAGKFEDSCTKEFLITLYTIKSISVDGATSGTLKLPIYSLYSLKINVNAYYGNADTVYVLDGKSYKISNLIAKLQNSLSVYNIWKYHDNKTAQGEYSDLNVGDIKYNSVFNFMSYDGYFGVYGYEVDIVTQMLASLKIGYNDGLPQYDQGECVNSKLYEFNFNLVFDYQADIKNPIPIQTAEDLYNMEENGDYRLTSDIHLSNHSPIITNIKSLDGNGYTIYITGMQAYAPSTDANVENTTAANIGLFANLNSGSMIYNLNVCYTQNVIDNSGVDDEGNYFADISLPESINTLEINATGLTTMNFGGIVAENAGIITNCNVLGKLKINANNEILVQSYNGGLVGINTGYITNSKVSSITLDANSKVTVKTDLIVKTVETEFTTYGNLGGFVGQNSQNSSQTGGLISTCYVDGVKLVNRSTNTNTFFTGGFVCRNEDGAQILKSYAQGTKKNSDVSITYSGGGVQSSGTVGGFVYLNAGEIQDSYTNIALSASTMTAGFVFVNEQTGLVNNCYSVSKIASNSRTDSPFTGIGRSGGVIVVYAGTISNCFYLSGDYYNFTNEPAVRLTLNEFATTATFVTFDISIDAITVDQAEGHTWIIKGGKPILVNTQTITYSHNEYVGKDYSYSDSKEYRFNTVTNRYEKVASITDENTTFDSSDYLVLKRVAKSVYYETVDDQNNRAITYLQPKVIENINSISGVKTTTTIWSDGTYDYLLESIDDIYEIIQVQVENGSAIKVENGIERNVVVTNYNEIYDHNNSITDTWEKNNAIYRILYDPTINQYYFENAGFKEYLNIQILSAQNVTSQGIKNIDLSLDRKGYCELTTTKTLENGTLEFEYKMVDNIQYYYAVSDMGAKTNPYLIYDIESFNAYFVDKSGKITQDGIKVEEDRDYYRFVSDIDFAFRTPMTSSRTLIGYVEGNGMTIKNVVITYDQGIAKNDSFGLFAQIVNSIVVDLNLQINEIVSSAHTYVGGLAGRVYTVNTGVSDEDEDSPFYVNYSIVNHVSISAVDENSVVLGRNIVGGLIGYATGDVRLNDITSSINANSVYVVKIESGVKYPIYQRITGQSLTAEQQLLSGKAQSDISDYNEYINNNISYAGAVVGILDGNKIDKSADLDYIYHANNITVMGATKVAGRVVGGMFGLIAKDNIAKDLLLILQTDNQSLRADFTAGGIVGENRGSITNITLKYDDETQEQLDASRIGILNENRNVNFFNNSASTVTIGGIVGFNNGGQISNAISHLDVRNINSTVAGGAVGRMVAGELRYVVVTGSVRAKSIIGGMIGTVNSSAILYTQGFMYGAQMDVLPEDVRNSESSSIQHKLPVIENCVAANNWLISDYGFITPRKATYRITGGFVGVEAILSNYTLDKYRLEGTDYVEIKDASDNFIVDTLRSSLTFTNCYYTYSAYNGSNPTETTIPTYIAPLYLSSFDAPYITNIPESQDPDKLPRKAINNINGLTGLTHFQLLYSQETTYNNTSRKDNGNSYEFKTTITGVTITEDNQTYYYNNLLRTFGNVGAIQFSGVLKDNTIELTIIINKNLISDDGTKLFSYTTTGSGDNIAYNLTISHKKAVYYNFENTGAWTIATNFYDKTLNNATRYPEIKKYSKVYRWDEFVDTDLNENEHAFASANGSYLIQSVEDLTKLAHLVNTDKNIPNTSGNKKYSEMSYMLTIDIDLSGKYWTPIGTQANPFRGIFNGDGHYINYVTVNSNSIEGNKEEYIEYSGLFGYVSGSGSVIENLNTLGGSIEGINAGGIVAVSQGTIRNCINANNVLGITIAGGVAGSAQTLENCSNAGNVTLNTINNTNKKDFYVGGVAGTVGNLIRSGTSSNSGIINVVDNFSSNVLNKKANTYVGGLYGVVESLNRVSTNISLIDTNSGAVNVTSNADELFVGGYAGQIKEGSLNYLYLSANSYNAVSDLKVLNTGSININYTNANSVSSSDKYDNSNTSVYGIGGVVGQLLNSSLANASNNALIEFRTNYTSYSIGGVGGIVGLLNGNNSVEQCYNVNSIHTNIVNTVTLCGVGGIVGLSKSDASTVGNEVSVSTNDKNIIKNTYNMGQISGDGQGYNLIGGILGTSIVVSTNNINKYILEYDLIETFENEGDENVFNTTISNSYNIGMVKNNTTNSFGWGAIIGFNSYTNYESCYYLRGTSENGGFAYNKNTDASTSNSEKIVDLLENVDGKVEQRTTSSLKDSNQITFLNNKDSWNKLIETWYPTLTNNYLNLYWKDYISEFESIASNSYAISTAEQLAYLSNAVNTGSLSTKGLTFTLKANIDLSNKYFEPIGTKEHPFEGTFNGDGYTIKYLTINESSAITNASDETVGSLFGYIKDATLTKIGLIAPTIIGVNNASGFVYDAINSTISYCYNEIETIEIKKTNGTIEKSYMLGRISSNINTAGLVMNMNNSTLSRSYNNVPLYQLNSSGYTSGLVMNLTNSSRIFDSYQDRGVLGSDLVRGLIIATDNQGNIKTTNHHFIALNIDETSSCHRVYNISGAYPLRNDVVDMTTSEDKNQIYNELIGPQGSFVEGDVGAGNIGLIENYPTPEVISTLGWDMINVWSSEYTLNESGKDNATLRLLGKNWINSESENIVLSNIEGKPVTERLESEPVSDFIYYDITSANQLAWVAYNINNGNINGLINSNSGIDASTKYIFRLKKDIDLSGRYWTPIGTLDNPFRAIFDFNNYTISNLVIDSENTMFAGLFGYTQEAIIRNGSLKDVYIKVDATNQVYEVSSALKSMYAGALVARAHNTTISNIDITANITGYSNYNIFMGSLVGSLSYANLGQVDSVKVYNIVIHKPDDSALIPDDYRGSYQKPGIDEMNTGTPFEVNVGAFSNSGNTYVGGVAGYVKGTYTSRYPTQAIIEYTSNNANVVSYSSKNTSYTYGGGIVGYMLENGSMNAVQNNGKIKTFTWGYDYVGGLAGMLESSELTNGLNLGNMQCSQYQSALSYTGGLVGYIRSGSILTYSINKGLTNKNLDSTQIITGGLAGYVLKDADGTLPTLNHLIYLKEDGFDADINGDSPFGDSNFTEADEIFENRLNNYSVAGFDNTSFTYENSQFKQIFGLNGSSDDSSFYENYSGWSVVGQTVELITEMRYSINVPSDFSVSYAIYYLDDNGRVGAQLSQSELESVSRGQNLVVKYNGALNSSQRLVVKIDGVEIDSSSYGYIDENNNFISDENDISTGKIYDTAMFKMPSSNVTIICEIVAR